MLHDCGHLAEPFQTLLRRQQLEFDFRVFTRSHGNRAARIVPNRLPRAQRYLHPDSM
jgi:hypothetical protein